MDWCRKAEEGIVVEQNFINFFGNLTDKIKITLANRNWSFNWKVLDVNYNLGCLPYVLKLNIKESKQFNLDNLVLTESDKNHPLFKGVALDNTEFSFAHHDLVKECPEGFKVIAKIDDTIAGIANDDKKRFGLLFHPEDMQRTYQVLDNFVEMFDNVARDQEALKQGKFQYLESYKS